MKLVLATRNAHKAREFAALLAPHEVLALPADVQLPPETGATFADNALVKARAAAAATGTPAIGSRPGPATSSAAPESVRTCSSSGSVKAVLTGTTTSPARSAPMTATTQSTPLRSCTATRSPGCRPRAA